MAAEVEVVGERTLLYREGHLRSGGRAGDHPPQLCSEERFLFYHSQSTSYLNQVDEALSR